jgi:hypothetical protein
MRRLALFGVVSKNDSRNIKKLIQETLKAMFFRQRN